MTKHMVFSLIVLGLAAIALMLIATSRIADFKDYHQSLAKESATSAAQEIALDIAEKRRLVEIFGNDHMQLIKALSENPDDSGLHHQIAQRIALYFPDYFTFTIADTSGNPYMEDFDGLIGELCARDLRDFAVRKEQLQRIHPHIDVYHFDILARLNTGATDVILFVSFHADGLGQLLKSAQATGHELMLIQTAADNLIEVTAAGPRINLDRDDYHLDSAEQQRRLFSTVVPGTRWSAVDFHAPRLFTSYTHEIAIQSVVIFILFLAVTLFMMRLIQKEERLRKAAEVNKDEFLSFVSHELRTPITSISGSLGLVTSDACGSISDKARELLKLAQKNCNRMNMLINDLLDLQKIEAGKMEFDIKPVDLDRLLAQCIEQNQGYADKFGAGLILLTPNTRLQVLADENRIMQVMSNLLSNAAKYGAKHDSIEIAVDIRDRFVRISVTDHGAGVPDSFRDNIFQKFSQAGNSGSQEVGGTGLGLSIVKSIIDRHDGFTGFRSTLGQGSTFFIDLPLSATAKQ